MKIKKIFLAFLLTTIIFSYANAWRRRRRRRCDTSSCVWIWGTCSKSCGGGYQSPIVTRNAGSCGSCNLPSRRSCSTQCCRVDCSWGPWNSYGSCSASCDGGISVRKRSYSISASCGGSSCPGSSTSSRTCNDVCCPVDCQWTQWTMWDACSKTCGNGTQSRHRNVATYSSCRGRSCQGSEKEERLCNDHCCPVDCLLSQWSAWGVCNATCGTGTQTRSRRIARQESCGGNACQDHMEESQSCNSHCCPVDCKMNKWSDWSKCSATCGPRGVSSRQRSVDIPPICGGASCSKERNQTRACNRVCMNNGTMDNENCSCTSAWSGECCLTDINECAANPCGDNTECKNIPGSFQCSCKEGFKVESKRCDKNDHGKSACTEKEKLGNYSSELNPPTNEMLICIEIFQANPNDLQKLGSEQVLYWKLPVFIVAGVVAGILLIVSLVVIYRKRRPVPEQQRENSSFSYKKQDMHKASDDATSNSEDTTYEQIQNAIYEQINN